MATEAQDLQGLVTHTMVDFNQMKTFSKDPLILTQGEGIHVTDINGKSYIDGLAGVFSVSLGHSATPVIDAMSAQLRRLAFASPIMSTTDRALELVGDLVDLTGRRMQYVKLLDSGSEATEAAMKMARQYHKQTGQPTRYKIMSFYNSYHGATLGALSATGWPKLRAPYEPLAAGFIHILPPVCQQNPVSHNHDDCLRRCLSDVRRTIVAEAPETIAAFIVEPVMLTAGVYPLPPWFLQGLRDACAEVGILLIFDELVTGFGRLGRWFAAEHVDVWPDFMCVGKGISGAYAPLAAVLMTERMGGAFWGDADKNRQYQAGHTHAGNPVSAAAGIATIKTMKERRIPDQVRRTGAYLGTRLAEVATRQEFIGAVRGIGLLYGLEFVHNRSTWEPLPASAPMATAVQRAARHRGLLLRASPHIATLAPPLIITEDDIDAMVGILEAAIDDVATEYRTRGRLDTEIGFGL